MIVVVFEVHNVVYHNVLSLIETSNITYLVLTKCWCSVEQNVDRNLLKFIRFYIHGRLHDKFVDWKIMNRCQILMFSFVEFLLFASEILTMTTIVFHKSFCGIRWRSSILVEKHLAIDKGKPQSQIYMVSSLSI